jgi:hypothetical protein
MTVRCILLFLLLLGIWGQAASACPEPHVTSAAAQPAIEITVSVLDGYMAGDREQRCECPATIQDAQALVSESNKSLLESYAAGAGSFLNPLSLNSEALAARSRASAVIARSSGRPPYLFVSRLLL